MLIILLFNLVHFGLVVLFHIFLPTLFFFNCCIVLLEKSLGFVMDEVAKHFEAVLLLNRLLLEQFCDRSDPLPQLF